MIRKINLKYLLVVLTLAFLVASANQPQSLDDWKTAQSKQGCESIPYYSYRDECKRKSEYDKTKELDFMKKSLETDISDIEIRLYKGQQCLNARTDVQKAFLSAISDAKRESDPEIKAIANQLISYWEKGALDHQRAFDVVNEGLESCKQSKSGEL